MRNWLAFAVFVAFGVLVAVLPTPQQATAASGFTDIPVGIYYANAVDWLVDQTITQGTTPTTFSPNDPVTRGQMAAFLWRFGFEPTGVAHGFGDVAAGVYFDDAVGWLLLHGVTEGTGPGTYGPDDPVTRAQIATFLWRYAGEQVPVGGVPFTDVPGGVWFTDAVAWMVGEGITKGTSASTFSPDAPVTRGQMATFLWRFAGEPIPGDIGGSRDPSVSLVEARDVLPGTISSNESVSAVFDGEPVDVLVVEGYDTEVSLNAGPSAGTVVISVTATLAATPGVVDYLLASVSCVETTVPCPTAS